MAHSQAAEPGGLPYFQEIKVNWRYLVAASAGLGAGYGVNTYVINIIAPHLLNEFHWPKAQFALLGLLGLLTVLFIPIVGRLTDLVGVRKVAVVGVVAFPLTYIAFTLMSGNIAVFFAITVAQNLLTGATTTSTVYSRLIAERFFSARGIALGVAATTPAAVGMAGSPILHAIIEAYGWRGAYWAVAAYVAIVGIFALFLIPPHRPKVDAETVVKPPRRRAAEDYPVIFRSPAFWIICTALLFGNFIYPLQTSQMTLMLLELGASSSAAAWMVSLFAAGVMVGRFVCGVALDRFPTHLVAALGMGLPGVGLFMLLLGFTTPLTLCIAVVLMGLSLGAEADLAAYLAMRFFKVEIYNTVLSLIVTAMAASSILASAILSITFKLVDNFSLFMMLGGTSSLIGGALFLLLGRRSIVRAAV